MDQIVVGRWGGEQGEEIVVARRGAETVEVHGHGGAAASARIVSDLGHLGCEAIGWQDWTADSEDDPIAAEARRALALAPTERTAVTLLDQYAGALRRALDAIHELLLSRDRGAAEQKLNELLRYAGLGQHLVKPWRVGLAGPPNVGKSSLINALVGFERAIVHTTPGTTRDVVTAVTALDGWPVELADTAGLRASDDPVEAAGVMQARQHLTTADCVVLVFDLTRPWTDEEQHLVESLPDAVIVHNKCDLPRDPTDRPVGIVTSALEGEGLETLERRIVERLAPEVPPAGAAVLFADSQIVVLRSALAAVRQGDFSAATEEVAGFGCTSPGDAAPGLRGLRFRSA
jgi:tRNA modification GTPase